MERTDLEYYRHRHAQELARANSAYDSAVALVHFTFAGAYALKVMRLSGEEPNLAQEQAEAFAADRRREAGRQLTRHWAGFPLLRN